jgi:hypothetical protein
MPSFPSSAEPPFAAEGGIRSAPSAPEAPFRALDDLMAAVESLCPEWPARPPFRGGSRMLL